MRACAAHVLGGADVHNGPSGRVRPVEAAASSALSIRSHSPVSDAPLAAVIVLAAGEGTRMKSRRPKVLHELGGRSLLGHVLAAVGPLGAPRTAVVIGAGRELVAQNLPE